jgi:hypothetical protein
MRRFPERSKRPPLSPAHDDIDGKHLEHRPPPIPNCRSLISGILGSKSVTDWMLWRLGGGDDAKSLRAEQLQRIENAGTRTTLCRAAGLSPWHQT